MNLSHLDFDIPNMEFTLDVSSLASLSGDIRISRLSYINSTNSYVRIYKPFMQNKPNLRNDKMNIIAFITMRYGKLGTLDGCKNKAKTNPIKAKTKPIQTQFNPKQTQFKPNFKILS